MDRKKKLLLLIMAVSLITLTTLTILIVLLLGGKYERLAAQASNKNSRLEYLLKANLLKPGDNKKVEIAKIYISYDNPQEAKRYLQRIRGDHRSFYLRGIWSEIGGSNLSLVALPAISNSSLNRDILAYERFLSGQEVNLDTLGDSDYAQVIKYCIAGTMPESKESYSYVHHLIISTYGQKELNEPEKKLLLAQRVARYQPKLTLLLIGDLKKLVGTTVDIALLENESYGKLEKFQEAELALKEGLTRYPENLLLLEKAIDFYRKRGDQQAVEYYQSRLLLISQIDK